MAHGSKLVRDRIPEIIAAHGEPCEVQVLDDAGYQRQLDAKLSEELAEYLADGDFAELVDLVEVIRAIVAHRGLAWDAFEQMRLDKLAARGGFARRLLLVESG